MAPLAGGDIGPVSGGCVIGIIDSRSNDGLTVNLGVT